MLEQEAPVGGIALVLGGGGPVGHAFHCGLLAAIEAASGWDPREADLALGTSAGAQVVALLRANMSTPDLLARATGDSLSDEGAATASLYVRPDEPEGFFVPIPQAPEILLNALRHPRHLNLIDIGVGLTPKGRISMQPMIEGVDAMFGGNWPPGTWITARELSSGKLVVFDGKSGATEATLGQAVAASGCVPGRCIPVTIGSKRYVDGGTHSPTNADLVATVEPEIAVVSSPMSLPAEDRTGPGGVVGRLLRRRLREELSRLPSGTEVVVFEPPAELRRTMGWNPMRVEQMGPVAEATYDAFTSHEETEQLVRLLEER